MCGGSCGGGGGGGTGRARGVQEWGGACAVEWSGVGWEIEVRGGRGRRVDGGGQDSVDGARGGVARVALSRVVEQEDGG